MSWVRELQYRPGHDVTLALLPTFFPVPASGNTPEAMHPTEEGEASA
jgi:hypothetical protein